MTRNRTLNIHTLSPLVLLSPAVLTVLIASAAPAHEAGARIARPRSLPQPPR